MSDVEFSLSVHEFERLVSVHAETDAGTMAPIQTCADLNQDTRTEGTGAGFDTCVQPGYFFTAADTRSR